MQWIDEAILEIKRKRIPHRNFEQALSAAMSALVASAPGEVVCITGPSRVGKSRLAAELVKLIVGERNSSHDGLMPVVSVQAANCAAHGYFSTTSFATRVLTALEHPFYGAKQSDDAWNLKLNERIGRTPERFLRNAMETGFLNRGTKFFVIDETHHIRYARGGDQGAAAILDSFKCLASISQLVLVFIGAYPLIDVLRLCPHLLGRKHQIHLPRYLSTPDDLTVFLQILDAYSSLVRLPNNVPSLRTWDSLLYDGSFGCIGLLEGWLRGALAVARSQGSSVLTKEHLISSRKSVGDREQLALEISQGEKALAEDDEITSTSPPPPQRPTKPKRPKPFQKKPRRYPVGGRT